MSEAFIFCTGVWVGAIITSISIGILFITDKFESRRVADCDDAFRKIDEQIAPEEYCVHYSDTGKHEFYSKGICSCGVKESIADAVHRYSEIKNAIGIYEPTIPPDNPIPPSQDGKIDDGVNRENIPDVTMTPRGPMIASGLGHNKINERLVPMGKPGETLIPSSKKPGCLGRPPAGMIPKAVVKEMVENARCGIDVPAPMCTQSHHKLRDQSGTVCTECGIDLYAPEIGVQFT